VLSAEASVAWAIRNNPELAALRQQHGIAAGAAVVAQTYPFNPSWTNKLFAANGPESAGITNRVTTEQRVDLTLELRGQGQYRRQAAQAALTRTDWEIADQELTFGVRTARAFHTVLYREGKARLIGEIIRLNEEAAALAERLFQQNRMSRADLFVIQTEVDASRALTGPGRAALLTAWADLRRTLGILDPDLTLRGTLDLPPLRWDADAVLQAALEQRPDLRARKAALSEAQARLRLEIADRYGNPTIGPDFEYNETRVYFLGTESAVPLPLLNTHRGENVQHQAERARAALDLQATQVQVRQDLRAALARLDEAQKAAATYRTQTLPDLRKSLASMEELFRAGQAGVTVLGVVDLRRKLLQARDSYLDALWEVSQARADLAAAVGDPLLAVHPAVDPGVTKEPTRP
jgi:cobalt-zinc-cadmium efflux system outer membrane protein